MVEHIIELAIQYGRYGYRRITAMLRQEGWRINHKEGRKNLEARRLEGTEETAEEKKALA